MNSSIKYLLFLHLSILISINAQSRILVWADEFDHTIDFSIWDYDIGYTWDNLHYYTIRPDNIQIVDSALNIIARNEPYMGLNYTSGRLKTKTNWKYGRFEALINLPATTGFVPAFWLLPADNIYGWWPKSGEIDIMEQPSNQATNIYGTIHTEAFNLFGGSTPPGDNIVIFDAQTAYHLYAVEWTPNKIDFFVDQQKYFTFSNNQSGSATWPFDKPFFIILNVAVGGGWVGNPDPTTVFPAIMEVDYVRVYQYFDDIAIIGSDFNPYLSSDISYSVADINGANYSWELPGNAKLVSGQNTNQINVDWNYFGGDIKVNVTTSAESRTIKFPVSIANNLLKNSGFEKGVKYWNGIVNYPAVADFKLDTNNVYHANQSLSVDVEKLGENSWDIQCSQKNINLKAGEEYILKFWAKTDNSSADINLAFISTDPFVVYFNELITLTNNWKQYEINYKAISNDMIDLNIDFGFQTGNFYLDNILFTTNDLLNGNQILNADFFEADSFWNFVTLSSAQASGNVIDGEYTVSFSDGGKDIWDVHLGQSGIKMENGQQYTVTFDAYAEAPRTISALVGKNSEPWTVYHNTQIFSLTTVKQTFTYSFVMNYPSDNEARFGFDIGGSVTDLYFDNVRISAGTSPTGISEILAIPKSIQLLQNNPNPFNPSTTIRYSIPALVKSHKSKVKNVTLRVYDILGREIATLVKKDQSQGNYEVEFDGSDLTSGIYFYRLQVYPSESGASEFVDTKKMLLIK